MKNRVLYVLLALVFPIATFAGINGTLNGTVKDKEGKPLQGATVRVQGTTRGAVVKANGSFTVTNIPAGTYEVKVSLLGFKEVLKKGVTINADRETSVNIVLASDKAIELKGAEVFANKTVQVDFKADAVTRGLTGSEAQKSNRTESALSIATVQAGVIASGGGLVVRGSRPADTQIRVDNLDVSDQISGGTGSAAGRAGSVEYMPTISSFATEASQVLTANFSAEYGNAMGGVINMVAKNGRTDKYEGYMRWRTDVPSLFGTSSNGFQALGGIENTYEFGVGGPLPFLNKSTFFISSKYLAEDYRANRLDTKDPLGNSLGQFADNGSEVKNITGRMRFQLDDNIGLILGGTWGLTSLAQGGWDWLYATTPARTITTNAQGGLDTTLLSTVPENVAKINALNNFVSSFFARVNHSLGDASFYELTLSSNNNYTEDSRRKIELGQGSLVRNGVVQDPSKVSSAMPTTSFFGGWDLMTPVDNLTIQSGSLTAQSKDKAIDYYQRTFMTVGLDGNSANQTSISTPNPLTGYVEDGEDNIGTANAYGINSVFNSRGNIDDGRGRGFEFRGSNMLELNGDYQTQLEFGETKHTIKTGINGRYFTIRKHNNSLPWTGNPFYDVYDDRFGGNLYAENSNEASQGGNPRNAMTGALFVQDQISYKGIIFNAGFRVDVLDPQSQYRVNATSDLAGFEEATMKVQLSPRLFVSYPLTDKSYFSIAYGIYQQPPRLQQLYDNTIALVNRGNTIVGNPNMSPERTNQFNVSYNVMLSEDIAFDVSAYYKDIYKLSGLAYFPDNRFPYAFYSNGEYGNARGVEFSIRKQLSNNFDFNVNYSLGIAQGTASNATSNYSSVITAGTDAFTNKKVFPLTEYALDFDRRHRINFITNFTWAENEGPSIAGVKFLENTNINFSGVFQTGTPFTLLDLKGNQAGEFNAERRPSVWSVDTRIQKSFFLKDWFGESVGNVTRIDFYVDVINMLNRTEPVDLYARTKDPDNDGVSFYRLEGEFPANWYAKADQFNPATLSANQYDRTGGRLYSALSDANSDGLVTQREHFEAYRRYVNDAVKRQVNYQFPRQVFAGLMFWF